MKKIDPMDNFSHAIYLPILIGIILFIGTFIISWFMIISNIENNWGKLGSFIGMLIILPLYFICLILYSIEIINMSANLESGNRAIQFCGKNIYILDTGEYKVVEGFTKYTSGQNINNKFLYIPGIITNVLIMLFYLVIILLIVLNYRYIISINDPNINTDYFDKSRIREMIIYFYAGASVIVIITLGSISSDKIRTNNEKYIKDNEGEKYIETKNYNIDENKKNKDQVLNDTFRYSPFSYILFFVLFIIFIPKKEHWNKEFISSYFTNFKTFSSKFFEKYNKYFIILLFLMILSILLNQKLSETNNNLLYIFNEKYIKIYIEEIQNNNIDKLNLFDSNSSNSSKAINDLWIQYFKTNIKNVHIDEKGDSDDIVKEYKNVLWKYIQFNDGKEFDTIINKLNKIVKDNNITINKNRKLLNYNNPIKESTGNINTTDVEKSLEVIKNIREICFNMRENRDVSEVVNNNAKNLVINSVISLVILLYLVLHPLIKIGKREILNYMVFIIIIFVILSSFYGWASGFTYL